MILFIKNITIEGPDTFGDFLIRKNIPFQLCDLTQDEPLPLLENIGGVVVLGGPMNVDEEERYPFLIKEKKFIKKVVDQNIPFLGICLGSQLLASVSGAKVVKSPSKEIGFSYVTLHDEGIKDPLFAGLKEISFVFQWHEDMFEIPPEGILLASSGPCPHQAFRVGKNAYGLQFHIEVSGESIQRWAEQYFSKNDPCAEDRTKQMQEDYQGNKAEFQQNAEMVFENFLKIIKGK